VAGNRLLLDTGVLIAVDRGAGALDAVIGDDDDVAIAAITAAELLEGVERAGAVRRPAREAFVETILANVPVEDYTVDIARSHARLLAHTRAARASRGAHDLIIAATAVATTRVLVTADAKAEFHLLPGVSVRLVSR
jgi:tRNA(fMet)-specific endonuclease VapC